MTPYDVVMAAQTDYGAVLAAVNALGANQREHSLRLTAVEGGLGEVKSELADFRQETRAGFRTVDEHIAEIKDLIVGRRNGT